MVGLDDEENYLIDLYCHLMAELNRSRKFVNLKR